MTVMLEEEDDDDDDQQQQDQEQEEQGQEGGEGGGGFRLRKLSIKNTVPIGDPRTVHFMQYVLMNVASCNAEFYNSSLKRHLREDDKLATFRTEVISCVYKRSEQISIEVCVDIFKRKFSTTKKHVCVALPRLSLVVRGKWYKPSKAHYIV
jgi:hypothetical protein